MDDIKAKQQTIEKINSVTNILITVSNDPSVDSLSAALGLTLILDKLDKHPTSIFSGSVPPAITFLEPEKTFDNNIDSLRDFIIALNKEKADHLRYKVEGDSVRIFITPYKTTITADDLEFSQGDYNVELVIALGVDNQDHLDSALATHGQILHDATIITMTAGTQTSNLGGIDWHDPQASSLSEMISGLAEALKTDKTKSLLDAPIATALLTGIVAETDRFSNTHTTSQVMTTAAQLMAGGADQQLIALKLQESHTIDAPNSPPASETTTSAYGVETPGDSLNITHDPNETLEQLDKRVRTSEPAPAAAPETPATAPVTPSMPSPTPTPAAEPQLTSAYALNSEEQAAEVAPAVQTNPTLDSATPMLSHAYAGEQAADVSTIPSPAPEAGHELMTEGYTPGSTAVNQQPASSPAGFGLPMPPPLPNFGQPTVMPTPTPDSPYTAPAYGPTTPPPAILGDILAPEPAAPSVLPPMPTTPTPEPTIEPTLAPSPTPAPMPPPPVPPISSTPTDPGQFKIPGQS